MLNLLLKLKSFLMPALFAMTLAAIATSWYWHGQYGKSQAVVSQLLEQNASCKASQELLESAVQRWKAAAVQHDKQLKRKEALVAQQTTQSLQRIQAIQQTTFSDDCNTAIQQGIQYSHKPGFNWHNNIP
jgi:hypothetical protein